MHHHVSRYYEIDKRLREEALQRELEQKYWIEQMPSRKSHRLPRWRTWVATIIGFFL